MLSVGDKFFNSVFISHSSRDAKFAKTFKEKLQAKLDSSIHVWMDDEIPEGKDWRQVILKHLNSTALVVVIVSPDAIKSPWVLYEWHYALLTLQDEPFFVYRRKCDGGKLNLFLDYQLGEPLEYGGRVNFDKVLENISKRFEGYEKLRESYNILTNQHEGNEQAKEAAANVLGNVTSGLSIAGTNYLIAALQFWLERNHSGYTLAYIATNLGRLRKRKAASVVMQAYLKQSEPGKVGMPEVLNPIKAALEKLTCNDPV